MSDMKKYTPPQIFEVPLRQEQAVLTACNGAYNSVSTTGTKCQGSGCKKGSLGTGNTPPTS